MNDLKGMNYESPVVEIVEVEIEQGFSISGWENGGGCNGSFDA